MSTLKNSNHRSHEEEINSIKNHWEERLKKSLHLWQMKFRHSNEHRAKTRVDYEIRYRELNFSTVWRSIVWAAGCASRAWKRDGRDGARFLKFVYQGVYDSRGQHRPGTSFLPSSWWKRDRERGKKTAWQTELTPPRRANFVCHVGRQPRRKFDQPDAFWNETFLKTTLAIKVLIDLSPHIDAIVGFLEIPPLCIAFLQPCTVMWQ